MRGETAIQTFPFAAIVGNQQAKLALRLLAVDRRLKGALIASPQGSAKSMLARAAKAIFTNSGDHPTPFIELPVGVIEDRLLGGLDFERTVQTGKKQFARGLLAEADGGVLYADEVTLLDATVVDKVAAALDNAMVRVEREGLSLATGADFVFIGSFNPEAGALAPLLRERVGLIVEAENANAVNERIEIIDRVLQFEKNPAGFAEPYEHEMRTLCEEIKAAKNRLPQVSMSTENLRQLASVALEVGVEGNRVDLIAARAARAHAALAKRDEVGEADLVAAIQLVLLPRATRKPNFAESSAHQPHQSQDNPSPKNQTPESFEPSQNSGRNKSPNKSQFHERADDPKAIEDLLIKALDARLPKDFLNTSSANPKSKTPNPKSASGKRNQSANRDQGRSHRVTAKKSAAKKLALPATIRAAAPFQKRRGDNLNGQLRPKKIAITADDLRYKKFKRKAGILFIFAIDASGSMALNRMAQAKGAMIRILQEAYIHRDKVAMLIFRGHRADLLLPPTRSVELAKRIVDAIPTGGATPLAAALIKALEVANLAQGVSQTVLLLFTDGRANLSARQSQFAHDELKAEASRKELRQLGVVLNQAAISAVVIDTKAKFLLSTEASQLADLIGAKYFYLPRADDAVIYESLKFMREER